MADVNEILKTHLESIKTKVAERIVNSGRNASGKSVASLKVEVNDGHGTLWGSKSFLAMERGRGPGAVPMNFTEIIYGWAKAKGISAQAKAGTQQTPDQALRSFAGAVAYNIMKKGTKLFRNRAQEDIYSSVIKEELELMENEMTISILDKVSIINDEAL